MVAEGHARRVAEQRETTAPEDNSNPFFDLAPMKLAEELKKKAAQGKLLSKDQEIYLDALLFNVAATAATTMEQEGHLKGELQARHLHPASGMGRVGPYEAPLYDLIDNAKSEQDVAAVRSIVKPQTFTYTSHPNFSRSRTLTLASRELAGVLGKLGKEEQQAIMEGKLPDSPAIDAALATITENLKPRKKRGRHWKLDDKAVRELAEMEEEIPREEGAAKEKALADYEKRKEALQHEAARAGNSELQETTLDMIPVVLDAASEQMRIFKQRKASFEKHEQGFSNIHQLEAVAAMLPEHNSWFLDGDGKRTVHAYDAEVAVPAIKRATYEEYYNILKELGNPDPGLVGLRSKLKDTIEVLKEVEYLATARMNAFNDMHSAEEAYQENRLDVDRADARERAIANAAECSKRYDDYINNSPHGVVVKKLMQRDDAGELKTKIGELLTAEYAKHEGEERNDAFRSKAEDLYVKLSHYGNFAIHLQRRENAQEYNDIFKYMVQNDHNIKEAVAGILGSRTNNKVNIYNINKKLNDPAIYSMAVQAFHDIVADHSNKTGIFLNEGTDSKNKKPRIFAHYVELAKKLGDDVEDNGEKTRVVEPLERRESLAFDGLGMFNMARLYPEAFKGGFVIAEFGQPEIGFLRKKNGEEIKQEVARISKNDLLLQMAFAEGMATPNVEIIPLHEDPSTMQFAADAQKPMRGKEYVNYMLKWLGIGKDNSQAAETRALGHINAEGKVEKLTAYQYMQQLGFTDGEMESRGLKIEKLKAAHVLEGPHDMEACSDNNKRAGIMGSVLADQSVRNKVAAAAASDMLQKIGDHDYMIVKPKYLGQGGSIARATQIPLDTVQSTWQGEHSASFTAASMAHKGYNSLLGRLTMREEAARMDKAAQEKLEVAAADPNTPLEWLRDAFGSPVQNLVMSAATLVNNLFSDGNAPDIASPRQAVSDKLLTLAEKYPNVGNVLGLPGTMLLNEERDQMMHAVNTRLSTTRDDNRYNEFLKTYGEPVGNYSARADAKRSGSNAGPTFNDGRAIGIAGLESGIFSNAIAYGEMFAPLAEGDSNKAAVIRMQEWIKKDPMMQHLVTAASLTANFVNLEEKWKRGGITYNEKNNTLTKTVGSKQAAVSVADLKKAYDEKASYQDEEGIKRAGIEISGITFSGGDLVMAQLTDQYQRMVQGLSALKGVTINSRKDLLQLFPREWQESVEHSRKINDDILDWFHKMKDPAAKAADKNAGKLALDAYYLLHESGTIYPMPGLLERNIFERSKQSAPVAAHTVA
ncbi:MAG: hypothetical protein SFX19_06560 [Alphaproteobacteria bacterium]|nr:hypothetical protein [Alphaproteobacteria bacterium]